MAKPRYTVMVRTLITPDQHRLLMAAAAAEGVAVSDVVRDALDAWLWAIAPVSSAGAGAVVFDVHQAADDPEDYEPISA